MEAASIPAAATGRVEIIDNDINDMPLTPGMAEAISHATEPDNFNKQIGRVEVMDDDTAPVPPAALQDSFNNAEDDVSDAAGKSNKQIRKLKISNEGEDEGPTHPMEYGSMKIIMMMEMQLQKRKQRRRLIIIKEQPDLMI